MLYNIERAKQVTTQLVSQVKAELAQQMSLDKFYDEGLQHLKTDIGEQRWVEIKATAIH